MKHISNNTKHCLFSTFGTILVIIALVAVNLTVSFLTDKFSLKADLTSTGVYGISQKTADIISNIEKPVDVFVTLDEQSFTTNEIYSRVYEFLKKYESKSNGKVKFTFIDTYQNPDFMSNYPELSEMPSGSLVVRGENRYRAVSLEDMYEFDLDYYSGSYTATAFDAEQQITSAVSFVSNSKLDSAYLLTGHGEYYDDSIKSFLEKLNFEAAELNLRIESLPADASVVIISSPQSDYSEQEISYLSDYVNKGGNIIIMTSAGDGKFERLSAFAAKYGITINNDLVLDPSRASAYLPIEIYPYISQNDIYGSYITNDEMIITPAARSLTLSDEENENFTVYSILETSDGAYAKILDSTDNIDTYSKAENDKSGTLTVAAMANIAANDTTGHILVIGSSYTADEAVISEPSLANSAFLSRTINYMTDRPEQTVVSSKSLAGQQLNITAVWAQIIFWVLVVILPLAVITCGMIIWLVRNRAKKTIVNNNNV